MSFSTRATGRLRRRSGKFNAIHDTAAAIVPLSADTPRNAFERESATVAIRAPRAAWWAAGFVGLIGVGGRGFQFAFNFEWFRFERAGTYLIAMILLTVLIDRGSRLMKLARAA